MGSTTSIIPPPSTITTSLSFLLTKSHSSLTPPSIFNLKPFSSLKPLILTTTTTTSPRLQTPLIPKSSTKDTTASTTATTTIESPTNLKSRLRNGETLYGLFLLSFSPTLAEISGLAGYDFVVIDMEHGHGGISDALPCMRALAATNTAAILRVPETTSTWAKKALDLGPQGIMFPMIESAKSAKKAVSFCRFPPAGVRGSAHPVVRASGYGIDEGYLGSYLEELLIMCQVESVDGVKNADEIAAVDGVDCVQMGPLDLSASMGYLWDPGNKKVKEAMLEAERKVLESKRRKKQKKDGDNVVDVGAYLSGFALPHNGPRDLRSRGYHMVAGAVDVGLFRSAAVEDVKSFKNSVEEGSDIEQGEGKDGDEKYWSE